MTNPSIRPDRAARDDRSDSSTPSVPTAGPGPDTTAAMDAIPAELRPILDLFAGELREVAFPGVDATVLRQHAEQVNAGALDVERARRVLDGALASFDQRTRALAAIAGRGLAYARIYAADQPALAARLAAIDGGTTIEARPPTAPAPVRRGRRKAVRPQLPLDGRVDADAAGDDADDAADDATGDDAAGVPDGELALGDQRAAR